VEVERELDCTFVDSNSNGDNAINAPTLAGNRTISLGMGSLFSLEVVVNANWGQTRAPARPYSRAVAATSIQRPFKRGYASDSASSNTPVGNGIQAARSGIEREAERTIDPESNPRMELNTPDEASPRTPPLSSTSSSSPSEEETSISPEKEELNPGDVRLPRAVQAAYLRPLRREAQIGLPVCDLQLRSYSVRNLEFFADFCMRAAYYLHLPAYGPIPLPRITERWTVPLGHFIHKKSQENFERRTVRRLIQIKDGDPETVEVWLAFVKKYAYYGIGMKANVWAFERLGMSPFPSHIAYFFCGFADGVLGVGKNMDAQMEQMRDQLEPTLRQFAFKKGSEVENKVLELINREDFKAASGGNAPFIRQPDYKIPKNWGFCKWKREKEREGVH
jgi:small subunit ribosomal protein S10